MQTPSEADRAWNTDSDSFVGELSVRPCLVRKISCTYLLNEEQGEA